MHSSAPDPLGGPAFRVVQDSQTDPHPPETVLSPAEIDYFHRDRDPVRRRLRMRVRATLRVWLGEFLRLPPALVPLHQAPSGLLGLLLPFQDWSVSVSASRDMGLLSVSPPGQGAVGVDIEWGDTTLDLASLAPPALSVAERSLLDTLPEVSRRAAFFRLWTRKEAVAKALALGVSAFDAGLDLASLPHTEMAAWQDISVFGRSLHLRDLPAPPGYHAALAVTR